MEQKDGRNLAFLEERTYVDLAERVILSLKEPKAQGFARENNGKFGKGSNGGSELPTTSKIRNILSLAADIYNSVMQNPSPQLEESVVSRIEYLRVRMIYESGRERTVKSFVTEAKLVEYAKMIGSDRKRFLLFYHYLEALIAFHRFYGGKEM